MAQRIVIIKKSFYILFFIISIVNKLFSQDYIVQVEDRNKAIELISLSETLIENNEIDKAYSTIVESINIDSTFRPAYLYLFKIFTLNNHYADKVLALLIKGRSIYKDDDELSFYIAEIYRMKPEYDKAKLEYNKAIYFSKINGENFPLVYSYYFNRGNCFMKLNQIDSAIMDYTNSIRLKPNYPNSYYNRGICYYTKKSIEKACDDWSISYKLGNNNAKIYIDKFCKATNNNKCTK
ncbi:MAG: tetratricopeptide repeat protein [Bacteroidota bacterium]